MYANRFTIQCKVLGKGCTLRVGFKYSVKQTAKPMPGCGNLFGIQFHEINIVVNFHRIQGNISRLQRDKLRFADYMLCKILSVSFFYGRLIAVGVQHIVNAESIQGWVSHYPGIRTKPGVQFVSNNNGFSKVTILFTDIYLNKKILLYLICNILSGFNHLFHFHLRLGSGQTRKGYGVVIIG